MIVMLLSVVWGRIQERNRNFGHLIHETWPRTYVQSVFKFYKKQTKSGNHKTCWDIVIWYMDAMIKISEDFMHVIMYDAYKAGHLYMWDLISHVEMSWFVSIVRDNVYQNFSNFYHSLHIWYDDISISFMIFGLCLLFIEFKNTFSLFACWFQPAQTSQPTVFSSHRKPAPASPNQHQHRLANMPAMFTQGKR